MSNVSARRTNKLKSAATYAASAICSSLQALREVGWSAAGDRAGELQQQVLLWRQPGGIEVTVAECFGRPLERCALQLQEPGVCAESIPAAIESGNVGRDHLVLGPGER